MVNRIYIVSTLKNGKVRKLYYFHGLTRLNVITKALKELGVEYEVVELTGAFYHNQVFDIDKHLDERKKMEETIEKMLSIAERRIKCVETGEICINARQFAEHIGMSPKSIHESIRLGRAVSGHTFIYTAEPLTIEPKEVKTSRRPSMWPGAFKVTCLETGISYDCVRDAARDNGICMQQVYNSIRSGRPRSGYTFIKTKE